MEYIMIRNKKVACKGCISMENLSATDLRKIDMMVEIVRKYCEKYGHHFIQPQTLTYKCKTICYGLNLMTNVRAKQLIPLKRFKEDPIQFKYWADNNMGKFYLIIGKTIFVMMKQGHIFEEYEEVFELYDVVEEGYHELWQLYNNFMTYFMDAHPLYKYNELEGDELEIDE